MLIPHSSGCGASAVGLPPLPPLRSSRRPIGVLLGVPLAAIALSGLRKSGWAESRRTLAMASPALGALPYVVWAEIDRVDW